MTSKFPPSFSSGVTGGVGSSFAVFFDPNLEKTPVFVGVSKEDSFTLETIIDKELHLLHYRKGYNAASLILDAAIVIEEVCVIYQLLLLQYGLISEEEDKPSKAGKTFEHTR